MSGRVREVSIIAVDTGGTFTDIVAWGAGGLRVLKVASTPGDPAVAVLEGIRRVLGEADSASYSPGEAGSVHYADGGAAERHRDSGGEADRASHSTGAADGIRYADGGAAERHRDSGDGDGDGDGDRGGAVSAAGPPVRDEAGLEARIAGLSGWVLVHGSTVATNALLERRGARVALVTNAGFEDVLEIGRQNRPQLYGLVGTRPEPLVPRERRLGVRGRMGPMGEELEALDADDVAALAERIRAAGVDAVAICLLHAYANPAHERRVAETLEPSGLPLSVSSALLPEYREYERTATTVVNAYVTPVMDRYLARLEREAGAARVQIMGSAGGAIPVARARREAVHTVLSGPAGGVIGALDVARRAGLDRIMTFDMGGTSTDVSLCPGYPLHTRELTIAGLPVAVPVLDVHTVGAGGGSIARVDAGGALRVGPESAGAEPGPVCYGNGGTAVTVTDANVWLGRLPARAWRHSLARAGDAAAPADRERGAGLDRDAIAGPLEALARAARMTADDVAEGVLAVADAAMEGALRVISVERGFDPVDFTLVAFGGAAGLHAVELARRLGIPRVLVPPAPGVLSAYGMLVAPVRRQASRTVLVEWTESAELDGVLEALEAEAREALGEEGVAGLDMSVRRTIDARYRGQSYELSVPALAVRGAPPPGVSATAQNPDRAGPAADWVEAFHAAHRTRYGYDMRGTPVQAVTVRVEAFGPAPVAGVDAPTVSGGSPAGCGRGTVVRQGSRLEAELFERTDLGVGHAVTGPAVISEYSATLWLPSGWRAEVLATGSMLVKETGP